jgi:YidC/Oxa1 family membrane protein insertase
MERRIVIFLVIAFALLIGYNALLHRLNPPKPQDGQIAAGQADKDKKPADAKKPDDEKSGKPKAEKPDAKKPDKPDKPAPEIKAVPEPEVPEQFVFLGSADPSSDNPFRMLVLLTNKGAAVVRSELNRYFDVDERCGYLGHVTMESNAQGNGCLVRFVGPGTPAAEAGLMPGDWIKKFNDQPISGSLSLETEIKKTKPNQEAKLVVLRKGKEIELPPVKLRRRPLETIKPEADDPLSMLLTMQQIGDRRLSDDEKKDEENRAKEKKDDLSEKELNELNEEWHNKSIRRELEGVHLRTANWKLVEADQLHATFSRKLPESGLEVLKTYRLAKAPQESAADADFPAYHLEFEIEIRNVGSDARKVAYRLDGPNGLPTEGKWYASKVSRNWGGAGLRDFVISFGGNTPEMVGPSTIVAGKGILVRPDTPPDKMLTFIGVDAQYFSVVMMPRRENPADLWFEELLPIRVGKVDKIHQNLTNTSCRLISIVKDLKPSDSLKHRYRVFAGPKKQAILDNSEYRLGELIYFGWPIFAAVAVPLTKILHFFHSMTFNYGLAIIMLTVLVRGCMFPLSLKQALGAQKMQILQPEIKKIVEKHKNNSEARAKAQQELFRKHNYNPLSGCLPIFIQMPIFIGLYRSLMVAIELRDAPLITNSIRWCSNLAAPDMLYDWSDWMFKYVTSGVGIFGLGPYFNLLPLLTIALFIIQQKMFMPPPTDEQSAMQQKIMKYMMIFMGLMFFKVASGLCIYFIASSLWGLAERRFLPKPPKSAGGSDVETRADAKARAREIAERERKEREKKEKK